MSLCLNVNVLLAAEPISATQYTSEYILHATFDGTEVVATSTTGDVAGDNVAAVSHDGNTLILTISKSVFGPSTAGGKLTAVFVEAKALLIEVGTEIATDRAPDADGVEYQFAGGGAPPRQRHGKHDDEFLFQQFKRQRHKHVVLDEFHHILVQQIVLGDKQFQFHQRHNDDDKWQGQRFARNRIRRRRGGRRRCTGCASSPLKRLAFKRRA